MPDLKDSNIEWIGAIPQHWETTKIKKEFKVSPSNVDKKVVDGEVEVKLCNYVDVYYNDRITKDLDFMIATAKEAEIQKFQLEKGDVLMTKDSEDPFDIAVPTYVDYTEPKLLCGYHLSMLRTINKKIDGKFLFWSLANESIASQLFREATGVTRWAIASRHIKNATIAFPPLEEQKAIADYLDKATAKIDRVIKIKEEQLDEISAFFKSRVFEFLTKGVESKPLKDTGYERFKEIPENWKVTRLKSVVSKVNSGVTPKGGATSYVNEGIPLIRSQNVVFNKLNFSDIVFISQQTHDKMKNSQVLNGDVLLNITGASIGRCYFAEGIEEANVNQHVCILRPFELITTKYLYYLMFSEIGQSQIYSGFTGSGREGISFESIKSFKIPLPPKEEQYKIIEKLDSLVNLIEKQKTKIVSQIDTLQEYRKSLIHECVTGKKQVCEPILN